MTKKRQPKNTFTPEIRDRAIRMVVEQQSKHNSQWAAIESIAGKFGCSPQTLHSWIKKRELDNTDPDSLGTAERERLKELEREVKELKTANEILRKASAFFAQAECDGQALLRKPK